MTKYSNTGFVKLLTLALGAFLTVQAQQALDITPEQIPGTLPSQRFQPTAGYGDSTVQTQLKVDVGSDIERVHFVRGNTDPFVLTKAYVLKHANPYAVRNYLLSVVRGSTLKDNAVQADAVRFNDGTGVVLISAEDYRFENPGNGESIDELVERLDLPDLSYASGKPKAIYFPRFNTAASLREAVLNVGASTKDMEFAYGTDGFVVDGELNAFVVAASNWSHKHIKEVLKEYDRPIPEVRLSYRVLEITSENDADVGFDFQSWKNTLGPAFFAAGGQYRTNWQTTFGGGVNSSGSSRTSYYNFNPRWSAAYLDFLESTGKARVVTSGTLTAQNRAKASIAVKSGLFYDDLSTQAAGTTVGALNPEGKETAPAPSANIEITRGSAQITKESDGFSFTLEVTPVVTAKSSILDLAVGSQSLIGWNDDGTPRTHTSSFNTKIQVGHDGQEFVVGGLDKVKVERSVSGVPVLKSLPWLGRFFSSERTDTKKSQIVIVARAEYANPGDAVSDEQFSVLQLSSGEHLAADVK